MKNESEKPPFYNSEWNEMLETGELFEPGIFENEINGKVGLARNRAYWQRKQPGDPHVAEWQKTIDEDCQDLRELLSMKNVREQYEEWLKYEDASKGLVDWQDFCNQFSI